MSDLMQAHVNQELVRFAIQTKITCGCGRILDLADAVLISHVDGSEAISCGRCYDAAAKRIAPYVASVIDTRPPLPARVQGARGIKGRVALSLAKQKGQRKARSVMVAATVYGSLAVHRGVDADGKPTLSGKYTVTHVPTGLAIIQQQSLADARYIAQQLMGLDWAFLDGKDCPPATKEATLTLTRPFVARARR